jgi:hypothetical protein
LKLSEKATTTTDSIPGSDPSTVIFDKVAIADDRKTVPATVKDSTDAK